MGLLTCRRNALVFGPAAIRQLKESAASDLLIGGAELAAHAFVAGLVDECHV